MIREMLHGTPTLQMSDHNSDGIQRYVTSATSGFEPLLTALSLGNLHYLICNRANGVFLWAFIVIEEILEAAVNGATQFEIYETLEGLPEEVESLYQGILDRMSPERRAEAAAIYRIVDAANFPVTIPLLQSVVYLIAHDSGSSGVVADFEDPALFLRRLHATMGGLFDFVSDQTSQYQISADTNSLHLSVRLLHQTVRAFSSQSGWVEEALPASFKERLNGPIWPLLWSRVLQVASREITANKILWIRQVDGKRSQELLRSETPVTTRGVEQDMEQAFSDSILKYSERSTQQIIKRLLPLLSQSIRFFPAIFAIEYHKGDKNAFYKMQDANESFCSYLASLHYALVGSHGHPSGLPTIRALDPEASDLMLAAGHGSLNYLMDHSNRFLCLRDEQKDDIVTMLLLYVSEHSHPMRPYCALETVANTQKDCTNFHLVIDMLLTHVETYTTFHLAVFLILGYSSKPGFIKKLSAWLGRGQPHFWRPVSLPDWASPAHAYGPRHSDDGRRHWWLPFERLPIIIWARDYFDQFPQQTADPATQLELLLSLGADLRSKDYEDGSTVVHYLVKNCQGTLGRWGYGTKCCRGPGICRKGRPGYTCLVFRKLYLLEQHGASFDGHEWCESLPEATRKIVRDKEARLCTHGLMRDLERMLNHKENRGHLPWPPHPYNAEWQLADAAPSYCIKCPERSDCQSGSISSPLATESPFSFTMDGFSEISSVPTQRVFEGERSNPRISRRSIGIVRGQKSFSIM